MERFTAYDLQRHVGRVQDAAAKAPVAITHHGHERFVLMDFARWRELGRGDALADAVRRLQANRQRLRDQGIAAISIFGSVARGDARDDSDIDLLAEAMPGIRVGGLKLMQWKMALTEILGREADVVVREFLHPKVEETMARDLIEALAARREDGGHAP